MSQPPLHCTRLHSPFPAKHCHCVLSLSPLKVTVIIVTTGVPRTPWLARRVERTTFLQSVVSFYLQVGSRDRTRTVRLASPIHHLAVLSHPQYRSNLPFFSDMENIFSTLTCTLLFQLVNCILYLFKTV